MEIGHSESQVVVQLEQLEQREASKLSANGKSEVCDCLIPRIRVLYTEQGELFSMNMAGSAKYAGNQSDSGE